MDFVKVTCNSCEFRAQPFRLFSTDTCRHMFCSNCLNKWFLLRTQPFERLPCPKWCCDSYYSDRRARLIVGEKKWASILQKREEAGAHGLHRNRPLRPRMVTQKSPVNSLPNSSKKSSLETSCKSNNLQKKQPGELFEQGEAFIHSVTSEAEAILLRFNLVTKKLRELKIKIQDGDALHFEPHGDPVWAYAQKATGSELQLENYNRYPKTVQEQLESWYQGLKHISEDFTIQPREDQLEIEVNADFSAGDSLSIISLAPGCFIQNAPHSSLSSPVFQEMDKMRAETFAVIRVIEPEAVKQDFDHPYDYKMKWTPILKKTLSGREADLKMAMNFLKEMKLTLERVSFADIELNSHDCFDIEVCVLQNFKRQIKEGSVQSQLNWSRKEIWIIGSASLEVRQFVQKLLMKLREYRFPLNWLDKIEFAQERVTYRDYKLEQESREFQIIQAKFQESVKSPLLSVTRIQNLLLWSKYKAEEEVLRIKLREPSRELLLWHGTANIPPSTISKGEEGFDMRFAKATGRHGAGNYFALEASYSCYHRYCGQDEEKQNKALFLARVLIGDPADKVGSTMNAPPPKSKNNNYELYDSVYEKGLMCVVYANQKAYPQYLVTFGQNPKMQELTYKALEPILTVQKKLPMQDKKRNEFLGREPRPEKDQMCLL